MQKITILIVILCMSFAAITQPLPQVKAQVYDEAVGSIVSGVLNIIEFNYSIWLGSRNRKLINDALAKIQMNLSPNQTVNVLLIATGSEKHPIFQRAVVATNGVFLNHQEWVVGRVTLQGRSKFYSASPKTLPIPSRSEFNSSIRRSFSSNVTYDDYVFLMNAVNNMIPTARVHNSYVHDLLDNTALAGATGTVILTAYRSDSTYRIYDAANNRSDSVSYRKGRNLSRMGNTVWILCRSNAGGEYVLVYTDLTRINVRVGDRVKAGSTRIGQWSNAKTKGFSLYRVHGSRQYFLRPDGSPKPYPILLNY